MSIEKNEEIRKILDSISTSQTTNIDSYFDYSLKRHGDIIDYALFTKEFLKYFSNQSFIYNYFTTLTSSLFNPSNAQKISQIRILRDIYSIQKKTFILPYFCFCVLSQLIYEKLKSTKLKSQTAVEFALMNGLSVEEDLNINQFEYSIAKSLNLPELTSWIIFSALDIDKRRKIKVSDFICVVDSFIENNSDSAPSVGEVRQDLSAAQMQTIQNFSLMCVESGVSEVDIYKNATNNETTNFAFDYAEKDKLKSTLRKTFKDKISENDIDKLCNVLFFNDNNNSNERTISFPHYNNVIARSKYNLLASSSQENFDMHQKRMRRLPLKNNNDVFDEITEAILKLIAYHAAKKNETAKPLKTLVSQKTYTNTFLSRKKKIDTAIPNDIDRWNVIDTLESIMITNDIFISSYDLFSYIKHRKIFAINNIYILIQQLDKDKDGFISYIDIINYLYHTLTYKSVQLTWRYVANYIKVNDISLMMLFANQGVVTLNDSVERDEFASVFYDTFNVEKTILSEMYDKLQYAVMIAYKRSVIMKDIIMNIEKQDVSSNKNNEGNKYRRFRKEAKGDNEKIVLEMQRLINTFINVNNVQQYAKFNDIIDLNEYKDKLIRKCGFNYAYGIVLYYKLKKDNEKNITRSRLFDMISSSVKFDKFYLRRLFRIINSEYTERYMILCIESIKYNPNGISSYDIKRNMNQFYPSLSNEIIMQIIKRIDTTQSGIISYKAIIDFISQYTDTKITMNLLIKCIASYLDNVHYDTQSYLTQCLLLNANDTLTDENSAKFLSTTMKLNEIQIEFFFMNYSITLSTLIKEVDFIRMNKAMNISSLNPQMQSEIVSLLNNIKINFSDVDYWNITIDLELCVNEIFAYINRKLIEKEITERNSIMKKISILLKQIDLHSSGFISYANFLSLFNPRNKKLHLKFISQLINCKFEGNVDKYLKYKKINRNDLLTKEEYEFLFFDEEMMKNDFIANEIFDMFATSEMFSINLYIKHLSKFTTKRKFDVNLILSEEIKKFENESEIDKKCFYDILSEVTLKNSFGKILCSQMQRIIEAKTKIKTRNKFAIISEFSNSNFVLFDIIRFINEIQKFTRNKLTMNQIKSKIKNSITAFQSISKQNFNLCEFISITSEFLSISEAIYAFEHFAKKNSPNTKSISSEAIFAYCNIEAPLNIEQENEISIEQIEEKIPKVDVKRIKTKKPKKAKKNLSYTNAAFRKFALKAKIASHDDLESFFTIYDTNQNGYISRDEFLGILNSFGDLNESEKILMLNYIDENSLDDISIRKFINIINSIKFSEDEYETIHREIEKEKKKFKSKINYSKFKVVYLKNKNKIKNIFSSNCSDLDKIIFLLQQNLYENYSAEKTIEREFFEICAKNNTKVMNQADFIGAINEVTHTTLISKLTETELIDIAFEDTDANIAKSLKEQNLVPYEHFIQYLTQFVIRVPDDQDVVKANISNKLDAIYKNRNKQFSNYLKMKVDFNKEKDVLNVKSTLLKTFSFSTNEAKSGINDKEMYMFKNFLKKINESNYKGIDYEIKDSDYFEYMTDSGLKKSNTIFNNERAALKKCEMIFNGLKDNELFFDEEFGSWPEDKDPSNKKGKESIYFNLAPKGQVDPSLIEWYRTSEISKNPQFLCNTPDSSEVVQGALGDCWFISALAAIATKDHLIRGEFHESILDDGDINNEETVMLSSGIYPPMFHYFRSKAIYCFRFYKDFKWRYVIIDDRLPCMKVLGKIKKPKVLYSKCRNTNEFWVSLIEKAYAKLHGRYEAMVSGCIDDGLIDLTGQESFRIGLELLQEHGMPDDRLWQIIKGYNKISIKKGNSVEIDKQNEHDIIMTKSNTVLLCSIEAETNHQEICFEDERMGILFNHGYPILNAFEIPKPNGKHRKTSRLIRLKNSWGFKTWTGKWSRKSEEFERNKQEIVKALSEIDPNANIFDNSSFIMCFNDFRKIITKLYIGIEFYPKYTGFYFDEHWSDILPTCLPTTSIEEFFNNPQYYLKVYEKTILYIDIMQNDPRLNQQSGNIFPYIRNLRRTSIIVLKTSKGKERLNEYKEEDLIIASPVRLHRDNSVHLALQPGEYIVIPTNCDRGKSGNFRLTFYAFDTLSESDGVVNFMSKLKKVYVCKLPNEKDKNDVNINPTLINEYSKIEIEKSKSEKKNLLIHQLKAALDSQKYDEKESESKKINSIIKI